jgi:hypothetical protein
MMHRHATSLIGALGLAAALTIACTQSRLRWLRAVLNERDVAALGNEGAFNGTFRLASGVKIPFEFGLTTKGNGTIKAANVLVRVYDNHDDGSLYEPRLLEVTAFADGEGEGLDLRGVRVLTDEDDGLEIGRRPTHTRLIYRAESRAFVVVGDKDGIVIWE